MHPNDSESFTGGIGGPSDPALVDGGQGRDPDDLIRDANIVAVVVMIFLVMIGLACVGRMIPEWIVEIFEVAR